MHLCMQPGAFFPCIKKERPVDVLLFLAMLTAVISVYSTM